MNAAKHQNFHIRHESIYIPICVCVCFCLRGIIYYEMAMNE